MKCPSCGTENKEGSKFCKNCGEKLQAVSTPTTTTSAPSSEPKDNKKLLIICATAIICAMILAGAFLVLGSSNSSDGDSILGSVSSENSSSDYYQYDFHGYTFNIPEGYEVFKEESYPTGNYMTHQISFVNGDDHCIGIAVANDVPGLSKETMDPIYEGHSIDGVTPRYQEVWGKKLYRFTNSTDDDVFFASGDDLISVFTLNEDLEPIISSIDQKDFPISSSSSSTSSSSSSDSMSYSEASSYMSGASNTVIENTFDEADANGDGVLTGSEITKFKKLADLTERTADTSNTENVEAQDYGGTGDGTTKTRYCTTHGRVAVGDDNLCPYCQEEGLDARTVKDSTEYI